MPRVLAIVLDVASVLVFAAIGRLSHGESLDATQLGRTAAPFLAATLMVWVAMIMKPFLESSSRQGLAVWAVTLVLGMLFRAMLGGGVQVSFIIVAGIALGVLMLGWRALAHLATRKAAR